MPRAPDRVEALAPVLELARHEIHDATLDPSLEAGQRIAAGQHRIRLAPAPRPIGSQTPEEILELKANGIFPAQAHDREDPRGPAQKCQTTRVKGLPRYPSYARHLIDTNMDAWTHQP